MIKKVLFYVAILVMMCGITVAVIHNFSHKPINYIEYADLKQAELKYWESKSHLVDEVSNYIQKVAPTSNLSAVILVDECEKFGVDIKFALAQGKLESHFGTQGLGAKTNSVWNVGAFDSLSYLEIHEKHIFSNPNASIEKYLELLTTNYLYGNKTELDLLNNFVDKNGKRYASSPSYETSLSHIYGVIQTTTVIDSLQEILRYWTVQSNRQN
jgi:flagellum-specific peptidoglycan hydrolase FlgJ